MHQRKSECEPLLNEMLTVQVESNLASPLAGNVAVEVNPRASVGDIVSNFLLTLQRDSSVPGLIVYDKHFNKLDWNASIESQGIEEGTKLYIGYDKTRLFRPFHVGIVGAAAAVIAILLFVVAVVLFGATGGSIPFNYGVVIDAGSTHTQVFLYFWLGSKYHNTGVVKQKSTCEYEAGIANRIDPENILSCVNNVTSLIPQGLPSPRLYLGATGGMRLLNESNPKDASLILMTLKYALRTSHVQVKMIDIIRGDEEAMFSWISTNFLKHILKEEQVQNTVGALDLGGASTQYAFAAKNTSVNLSSVKDVELFGHKYSVSSESFLCFGYYEALDRSETIMIMNNESETLFDPCLPVGFNRELEIKSLSEKPCLMNEYFIQWMKNHPNINKLIVIGASNYTLCKKSVDYILDESSCKDLGFNQCLKAPNLGSLNIKFMAFSGFYYVVNFLNATGSLDKLISATKEWCNMTWDEIKQSQPESQLQYVSRYCFAATYIIELLTSKYGFDSTSWKNLEFSNQIEGADVGWSLGFMIYATNGITEELPSPPVISLGIFVPLLIVSISMAFVSILVLRSHVKHIFHRDHERLLNV